MTNAHAPNRKPGNRNARKRRIRSRLFFVIESRAWRGPSQIWIRKPNRFPGVRAAATGSGGGEGISGRFGGGGAKQERQSRAPCHLPLCRQPPPSVLPYPHAHRFTRAPGTPHPPPPRLWNSRIRPNSASESGTAAWPPRFTHPLHGPCFLSGTRSAYPLRGLCFLPATENSNPRLANECKAGPGLPWALKRDKAKLRRFLRGSSPVAGPRRPRHRRAGKNAKSNAIQINSLRHCPLALEEGSAVKASAVDTALQGVVSSPQVPVRHPCLALPRVFASEEVT